MLKEKLKKSGEVLLNILRKYRFFILFFIMICIGYYYRNIKDHTTYSGNKAEIVETKEIVSQGQTPKTFLINRNLYGKTEKEKKNFLLTNFDMDNYILGNDNATINIIDYSSFTCVFCKSMRDDIKKIIDEFVKEKGVANYVLRPFYSRKTLPFGALLLCADLDKREVMAEEFFNINLGKVDDLEQELVSIGIKYGIDEEIAKKCINDENAYDRIIYMQNESSSIFDLSKSPLLIINGKEYVGYKNYDQIKSIIEKNLKKNAR